MWNISLVHISWIISRDPYKSDTSQVKHLILCRKCWYVVLYSKRVVVMFCWAAESPDWLTAGYKVNTSSASTVTTSSSPASPTLKVQKSSQCPISSSSFVPPLLMITITGAISAGCASPPPSPPLPLYPCHAKLSQAISQHFARKFRLKFTEMLDTRPRVCDDMDNWSDS